MTGQVFDAYGPTRIEDWNLRHVLPDIVVQRKLPLLNKYQYCDTSELFADRSQIEHSVGGHGNTRTHVRRTESFLHENAAIGNNSHRYSSKVRPEKRQHDRVDGIPRLATDSQDCAKENCQSCFQSDFPSGIELPAADCVLPTLKNDSHGNTNRGGYACKALLLIEVAKWYQSPAFPNLTAL